MASDTKKTEMRRRKKLATNGRQQSKARAKSPTPKFPIHQESK